MASVPFTSHPLAFIASDRFRFGGGSGIRFVRVHKNQKLGFPLCRASSSSLAFRDLDADDFRHPLDKQVLLRFRVLIHHID
jgi:hypothetical protein